MPDLTSVAVNLYRKLFGAPPGSKLSDEGLDTVLDGNTAIALVEAMISEDAVMGGSWPTAGADLAWRSQIQLQGLNYFGSPLKAHEAESPRGAVAAAIGLALTGRRVTTFLSGPDLAAVQDLLTTAAGRHLPLVVHVTNRSVAGHGGALGSGHEAYHLSADSGFFTLFASTVQEAIDFTCIARRVAEETLAPALVAIDAEATALSLQDVRLPSPAQIERYLGPAAEMVPAPTEAQRMLFGESRRRVPRWFDPDRPVLQGALFGPDSFVLGAEASKPYFAGAVDQALRNAFGVFHRQFGRSHGVLSRHHYEGAEYLVITEGAAVESVAGVAAYLRAKHKIAVGCIGVHALRPFPGEDLVNLMAGKKAVVVLERVDTPLAGDTPLMREVRSVLAGEERPLRRCHSVRYGPGGQPLRAADLIALVERLASGAGPAPYLGTNFGSIETDQPKRRVLTDALRRAYPTAASLGLIGADLPADFAGEALSLAVHRAAGRGGEEIACAVAEMLGELEGGAVRTLPGLTWEEWAAACIDRVVQNRSGSAYVGDDAPVSLAVVAADRVYGSLDPAKGLTKGGSVLFRADGDPVQAMTHWSPRLVARLRKLRAIVYHVPERAVPAPIPSGDETADADSKNAMLPAEDGRTRKLLDEEYMLGALFGVLIDSKLLVQSERRLLSVRGEQLTKLPAADAARSLAAFEAGLRGVRQVEAGVLATIAREEKVAHFDEVPMAVEHLGRSSSDYDSLPRFWDQLGVLVRNDELEQVSVDPYLGTGSVPPLSATLRDLSMSRASLPSLDPTLCTGCGACWAGCPDSAIGVVAIKPATLLDTGIRLTGADPLRPIASQLAGRIISEGKADDVAHRTAGEFLGSAFEWLGGRLGLEGDRKASVDKGVADIVNLFGALPLAATKPFFQDAEARQKDGAEFLSLVVNPDACKGCGLCVERCESGAWTQVEQTADDLAGARSLWRTWARTPDTSSETIERVAQDPAVGEMAAVMLSRFCAFAMSGGDGGEAGSGEKIAVRMALAATEYQQQPLQHRFIQEVQELREKMNDLIRRTVSRSLPTEDLDLMLSTLDQVDGTHVDLSLFASKVEEHAGEQNLDSTSLRNMIEVARDLTTLHWNLAQGPNRLGRARFGLAVAPGSVASWAGAFPYNPFQVPVMVDMTGDAAQMAAGLLEGQISETVRSIAAFRRAELALDTTGGDEWQRDAIRRLGWDDLSNEEKQLCPPLILLGDDEVLAGRGYAQVAWLLNSKLPIKILVTSSLDFGLAKNLVTRAPVAAVNNPRANMGLMALAQHNAFVAQTSIASPDHLRQSMREAIRFTGPALLLIHAPSPGRHGFEATATFAQAALALESRAFPLFRYDPRGEGVFGSRIDLSGNPDPLEPWSRSEGEERVTPVHWAWREARFRHCFRPIDAEDKGPTPIESWLDLEGSGRRNKTPCLAVMEGGQEMRYRIDPALVSVVDERGRSWRMLQELAGLVTPFTAKVEQEAQERAAAAHQAEIAALKKEYEEKLADLEQNLRGDMVQKVREQLLRLSNYRVTPAKPAATEEEESRDASGAG